MFYTSTLDQDHGSRVASGKVSGPIRPSGAAGSPSLAPFLSSPAPAMRPYARSLQPPAPAAHPRSPLNAALLTCSLVHPRFSNADGKQGLPWLCVACSDPASPHFMQYVGSSMCQRPCQSRGRNTATARICLLYAGLIVDPWCPCLPAVTQVVLGTFCARPWVGVPMLHAEEDAYPCCRLVANELRASSLTASMLFHWHNWNSALITALALVPDSVDDAHLQLSVHGRSRIGWSPIHEGRSEYRSRQRTCLSTQLTMPDATVPTRGNVTGTCTCFLMALCAQLSVVKHLSQNFADSQGQDCCTATEPADFLPCRDGIAGRTYPVTLMRMRDAPERAGQPNDRRKLRSELGSSTGAASMFGQIPRLEHPKILRCLRSLKLTLAEICSLWCTRMCPMYYMECNREYHGWSYATARPSRRMRNFEDGGQPDSPSLDNPTEDMGRRVD